MLKCLRDAAGALLDICRTYGPHRLARIPRLSVRNKSTMPQQNTIGLTILRGSFLAVAMGVAFALTKDAYVNALGRPWWLIFFGVLLIAVAVIVVDIISPRKRIAVISSVYLGVLVGLLLTYLLGLALAPLFEDPNKPGEASPLLGMVQLLLAVCLCYACISLLLQTRDDFRFIIPYVEFAKEVKGLKPYVLDTSVVIDGRIADLIETGVLDNQLIMPRFVLNELQSIADSSDKMRRSRGRRGLDILNRLRNNKKVELKILDRETREMAGQPVDMKLVLLAKHLEGKIVTGDYNLNKVAKLHNVPVINLNDVANSLKPVFLPGEDGEVRVVKPGEDQGQGVGYLDDGTMVVIEGGRNHVGETVRLEVTSVLQTSAGRMVFGKFVDTV